jgi:hypothetical protein
MFKKDAYILKSKNRNADSKAQKSVFFGKNKENLFFFIYIANFMPQIAHHLSNFRFLMRLVSF